MDVLGVEEMGGRRSRENQGCPSHLPVSAGDTCFSRSMRKGTGAVSSVFGSGSLQLVLTS